MPIAQLLYGGSPVALTGNTDLTLLSSAARTATVDSADQQAYFAHGVYVYLVVSAIADTPSIVLKIQGKLPDGTYIDLLTATAVTGTGTTVYLLYPVTCPPGVAPVTKSVCWPIPLNWRVRVEHGDADSITYSVMATVVI
jgi:hypothetical protein